MKSVSIIIVNYNTFALTCNCIQSISEREPELDYEIILVDNGSSEIDPMEFKKKFSRIVLIASPINVGFAKGNNLGIAQSKGKHIVLLNSDTILLNNAVTLLVSFLNENSQVAAATGRLEYENGLVQNNCQRFPSIRYKMFELLRLQKIFRKRGGKILFGPFFNYDEVSYPDWVWGTCFMFERSLLNMLPGEKLADDFFLYVEDMQWCMEIRKLGFEIAFLPAAKIVHLMGASGGVRNDLIFKNTGIFMRMYYPRWKRFLIGLLDRALTKSHAS